MVGALECPLAVLRVCHYVHNVYYPVRENDFRRKPEIIATDIEDVEPTDIIGGRERVANI
jgi:hypothetical protein